MNNRSYCIYCLILLTSLISCRVNRPVISPSAGEAGAREYIQRYKDLAVSEMIRSGVPASITLAQGMVESNYGRSTLARTANNHFGIKCHEDWKGPGVRHHDDRKNECFRKYSRPEDSFIDHSDFLRNRPRYGFLFTLPVTDYKGWARGLKQAGYATNPDYADMLIRKIEEHNLQYFDGLYATAKTKPGFKSSVPAPSEPAAVKINPVSVQADPIQVGQTESVNVINDNFTVQINTPRVMENNRLRYVIVKEGETIDIIEREFIVFSWELQRFNDIGNDYIPAAGQVLYLQPKRDRAERGKEKHIVGEGETMHSISQKYGVKLKKLYEYNRMDDKEEATEDQVIWLRRIKPAY
ncbi:MAG TPA: hypothetical protein DDW27_15155 [Bacteroidales bacterium]|nr:hypothetical protein [Bacteroidales bacterium]